MIIAWRITLNLKIRLNVHIACRLGNIRLVAQFARLSAPLGLWCLYTNQQLLKLSD